MEVAGDDLAAASRRSAIEAGDECLEAEVERAGDVAAELEGAGQFHAQEAGRPRRHRACCVEREGAVP